LWAPARKKRGGFVAGEHTTLGIFSGLCSENEACGDPRYLSSQFPKNLTGKSLRAKSRTSSMGCGVILEGFLDIGDRVRFTDSLSPSIGHNYVGRWTEKAGDQ
jgi:hypothetical protein